MKQTDQINLGGQRISSESLTSSENQNNQPSNLPNFSNTTSNNNSILIDSNQQQDLCAVQISLDQLINQTNQEQQQTNFSPLSSQTSTQTITLVGFQNNLQANMIGSQISLADNDKEEELRQLLTSWNLDCLLYQFIEQKIFVDVLKIMKLKHIHLYLKNISVGDKILFEYKLEQWRQSIDLPLERDELTSFSQEKPMIQALSPNTSSFSSPNRNPCNQDEEYEKQFINLSMVLNNTARGQFLANHYKTFQKFGEEQRKMLINTIVSYFEENHSVFSLRDSRRIEKEIVERFPTENLEYYRTSTRGRIYNKFTNNKRSFRLSSSPVLSETETKQQTLDSEENADEIVRAIKFDTLAPEDFDRYWQACSNHRLNEIKSCGSTAEALQKWPEYKKPLGFRLIDMDFKALQPKASSLLDNWVEHREKIAMYLSKEQNIKERRLVQLLEEWMSNKINENSKDAVLFHIMHGFLIPSQKVVVKDNTGKKCTTKYTIKDSQEAFLFVAKSPQEVEAHLLDLKNKAVNIQPFLIGIGESIKEIKEYFIYFDGIQYSLKSCLRGVDVVFKVFHVFNLEYPIQCTNFWCFMQEYIYKIKCPKKNQKNALLGNALKYDL